MNRSTDRALDPGTIVAACSLRVIAQAGQCTLKATCAGPVPRQLSLQQLDMPVCLEHYVPRHTCGLLAMLYRAGRRRSRLAPDLARQANYVTSRPRDETHP